MEHTLDIAKFRLMFPAFGDTTLYPDTVLEAWFSFAKCEINPVDSCVLRGDCLDMALMLCLAHILQMMTDAAKGTLRTGAITGAAIDKVSASFTAPPFASGWQYWLSMTPYGLQLWGLLGAKATGGFYIGGRPEQAAFRKAGGRFR